MKKAVEFKNFSFKYDTLSQPTLKNIDLVIYEGEKVLIAGASGSGKSTLGHCINGLIPFSKKGDISGMSDIFGMPLKDLSIYEISKKVGTILQDQDCQFVGLSVGEDVAFIDENHCIPVEEMEYRVKKSLQSVDMLDYIKKIPQELSGGQKQRVSLAGVMNSNAPVLLLDEPLANLDPASGEKTVRLINKIHELNNCTVIVIEHRIEEILQGKFDKIVIMDKGEIVYQGPPEEVLKTGILAQYGLREPLYIDAMKYAGIDLNEVPVYPIENVATDEVKKKIIQWCQGIPEISKEHSEKILEISSLNFSYDQDKKNLKDVNLTLDKGEILAILGNNGAGKSTLCKVITGIERQQSGSIKFANEEITSLSISKRAGKIGYVMQNPNHMLTQETVLDEVELGLKLRKISNSREKAEDTLKICGLNHLKNWPVTALSYGQKKRVTIAAILALEPQVIILDEPTAGQDHKHYLEFMEFVKRLTDENIGIILITHDMHLSLEYADRAVVLCNGEVILQGKPSEVFNNNEVMKKANLKETSLIKLGNILGIDGKTITERFIQYEEVDA